MPRDLITVTFRRRELKALRIILGGTRLQRVGAMLQDVADARAAVRGLTRIETAIEAADEQRRRKS